MTLGMVVETSEEERERVCVCVCLCTCTCVCACVHAVVCMIKSIYMGLCLSLHCWLVGCLRAFLCLSVCV